MNPLDYQINKLKEYQKEMVLLNKRKVLIANLIKEQVEIIESLKEPAIKPINETSILSNRDIEICRDFIIKNKRVSSRQIIDHLNQQLEGQTTRWKNKLDGNTFMSYMGRKLEYIAKRTTDENNKKLNYWEII